jgi:hypothetical protein
MRGRDIFLCCDHEGCDTEEYHAVDGGATFAELEADAKADGWTIHRRGAVHLCPDHAQLKLSKSTRLGE